jgi:hypothetical protein
MAITGTPEDYNFLSPLGFKFIINKIPNFDYFVQGFEFPAVGLNTTKDVQTPFNKVILAGDHLTFDEFAVTFKIDEDMYSYTEVFDWIVATGFPESFEQYKAIAANSPSSGKGVLVDADLIIMNGTMNPNIKFTFNDVLPVRLGGFNFDSTANDVKYITCRAVFKYRQFTYTRQI